MGVRTRETAGKLIFSHYQERFLKKKHEKGVFKVSTLKTPFFIPRSSLHHHGFSIIPTILCARFWITVCDAVAFDCPTSVTRGALEEMASAS